MAIVALALVLLLLAAGAGCGGDDGAEDPPLEGTAWTLVGGVGPVGDEPPTLSLEEGQASGFAGCNRFRGGYESTDAELTFDALATTFMACPEPQMQTETAYLAALEGVDSWTIENEELVLSGGDGELLRYRASPTR